MTLVDAIGWIGAIALLTAFVLNLFKKISSGSNTYLLLNLIGSLLLLSNAFINAAYPFVVVNLFWVVFSGFKIGEGLVRKTH